MARLTVWDMVANIDRVYQEAINAHPQYYIAGRRWYPDAHNIAVSIAAEYGDDDILFPVTLRQTALIMSILSPQKAWPDNVRDTWHVVGAISGSGCTDIDAIRQDIMLRRYGKGIFATGNQLEECLAVIVGGETSVQGLKRTDFADLIETPNDPYIAVADRHAVRVAHNDPEHSGNVSTDTAYHDTADAYRYVAATHDELPSTVQGTTWEYVRHVWPTARRHYSVIREHRERGYVD